MAFDLDTSDGLGWLLSRSPCSKSVRDKQARDIRVRIGTDRVVLSRRSDLPTLRTHRTQTISLVR